MVYYFILIERKKITALAETVSQIHHREAPHTLFKEMFPEHNLINKHHYMIHYSKWHMAQQKSGYLNWIPKM